MGYAVLSLLITVSSTLPSRPVSPSLSKMNRLELKPVSTISIFHEN